MTTGSDMPDRLSDWRSDEGWGEFYRQYAPAIMAHALERGLSREEAEDVVQTTMTKVALHIKTFESNKTVCRFRTWLNQVVNQRMVAIWRARARSRSSEAAWVELAEQMEGATPGAGDAREPSEVALRVLELCLNRLRAKVNPLHWQVFEANALLGLSGRETAEKHGTTVANVWVVRHRMIHRLRREWLAMRESPFEE